SRRSRAATRALDDRLEKRCAQSESPGTRAELWSSRFGPRQSRGQLHRKRGRAPVKLWCRWSACSARQTLNGSFDFSGVPDVSRAVYQFDLRRVASGNRAGNDLEVSAFPSFAGRVAAVGQAGVLHVPPRGRHGRNRRQLEREAAAAAPFAGRYELDRRFAGALNQIVAAAVEGEVADGVGGSTSARIARRED